MARRRVSEPGCNGPRIWFQLAAHDEHEKIAIGTHKLRVIQAARLARKVAGKLRQHKS